MKKSTLKFLCVFLSVLSVVTVANAEPRPTFSRIVFSDTPSGGQPSVALEPDRGFIVTWQSTQQDVTSLNWLAVNFDGEQTGRGVIAQGSNWFVNWADTPALAVLDNGDWVAFWLERMIHRCPKAMTSASFVRRIGEPLGRCPSPHIETGQKHSTALYR